MCSTLWLMIHKVAYWHCVLALFDCISRADDWVRVSIFPPKRISSEAVKRVNEKFSGKVIAALSTIPQDSCCFSFCLFCFSFKIFNDVFFSLRPIREKKHQTRYSGYKWYLKFFKPFLNCWNFIVVVPEKYCFRFLKILRI